MLDRGFAYNREDGVYFGIERAVADGGAGSRSRSSSGRRRGRRRSRKQEQEQQEGSNPGNSNNLDSAAPGVHTVEQPKIHVLPSPITVVAPPPEAGAVVVLGKDKDGARVPP